MYQPPPTQPPREPRPAGELLDATIRLYRRAFQPLVLTAGLGALLANLLAASYAPTNQALLFLWTLFVLAISITVQSALLLLAQRVQEARSASAGVAIAAIIAFGPRYFAATFLVNVVAGALFVTVFGIPLAAFLYVRFSLFGPAIVIENRNIVDALIRSWRLVEGRWWRTFGLQVVVGLPFAFLSLLLFPVENVPAGVILRAVAAGLAIPLVAALNLLLFEDYRKLTDGSWHA